MRLTSQLHDPPPATTAISGRVDDAQQPVATLALALPKAHPTRPAPSPDEGHELQRPAGHPSVRRRGHILFEERHMSKRDRSIDLSRSNHRALRNLTRAIRR